MKNYQIYQHFHQKEKKRPKRLIKYQILRNELPLFDDVGILGREYAIRNYAGLMKSKLWIVKAQMIHYFQQKNVVMIFSEIY